MSRDPGDVCRRLFENCKLRYVDLTEESLGMLVGFIQRELDVRRESTESTYLQTMYVSGFACQYGRHGNVIGAMIRVSCMHFSNRQGVGFDEDGYIGIAEWADPITREPIACGFKKWCATMMATIDAIGDRRWMEARSRSFPRPMDVGEAKRLLALPVRDRAELIYKAALAR